MNNQMNNQNNNSNVNTNNISNPINFYIYVNTLINRGYSKYNAIITFLNDTNIDAQYKQIPEVQQELDHGLSLLNNY